MKEQAFFMVITLLGGVAFFLFGMNIMSGGLEKMTGGALERTMKKLTSNPFKSLVLGAGITIAIQSSSALTVMLVGLVNSGIMTLHQTVGVIMGSNIGTTLTAWILSLAGVEGNSFFISLLKPTTFAPILAVIGIALTMLSKKTKRRDIGTIMLGFSILMFGMEVMKDAVAPLADNDGFKSILTAFSSPVLGVLVGAVFTGIIQSSAASVGVLMALSAVTPISYSVALPIIMGQNIGTCVTALISSIGASKNAKQVALVHVYFNVIGTIICLVLIYSLNAIFHFEFMNEKIGLLGIAIVHSLFNVITTAILLPFPKYLEKLATITIPDKQGGRMQEHAFLDERLLHSPSFAIVECRDMTIKMAHTAQNAVVMALELVHEFDEKKAELVVEMEQELDMYEDRLGTFLVKLSSKELSDRDSNDVSMLLHTIGNFERIGDHAVNIHEAAREMYDKNLRFSDKANEELEIVMTAMREIVQNTIEAFDGNSPTQASHVEPLEEVIDVLVAEMRSRHIKRLQRGECTIELGFVWSDLMVNFERVSDHCSNIAVSVIQINDSSFDTHNYLNDIKLNDPEFLRAFEQYKLKYALEQ